MKRIFKLFAMCFGICAMCFMPFAAHADIIDSLSLSPFIPMVLDAFMSVAMTGYEFFVGNGTGIIYILIYGWFAITIGLYLVKQYFPDAWISFFGLSPEKESVWNGKLTLMNMSYGLLKPALRAIIAITILLQVRPQYITNFVVDPFLRFGGLYTDSISEIATRMNSVGGAPKQMECPPEIISKGYISAEGCRFIVQPVEDITHANNVVIKRGFAFFMKGLSGMLTPIPHGGEDFMNLITGMILIGTFVASNFFMALLIIQALFTFGMALILYPFKVLTYVAKPKNPESWIDPWDAFDEIIPALKTLVITMIACMFIMIVNIAAIGALLKWNSSVFIVAAGGSAHSNLPAAAAGNTMGFGQHSITWLSAILTFYLMYRIFEISKEQLQAYTADNKGNLYDKVSKDAKHAWMAGKTKAGTLVKTTKWAQNTKLGKWVGKALTGKP
ncbi:MAG: hypothetical protein LBK26_04740 [Rickettsiales bacterium]|jgi:hypothetical protein|nr:hypothetical protein [Rickettsiales bacterium]